MKMKLAFTCLVFSLLAISSCTKRGIDQILGNNERFEMAADLAITLDQSACYGTCPVFKVMVKADGTVLFEGGKYTSGKNEGKIDPVAVRRLLDEANAINFLGLNDKYDTQTCPNYATDHSTIVISVSSGGHSKTISHYLGCVAKSDVREGYPPGLSEFEGNVITVTDISKWFSPK